MKEHVKELSSAALSLSLRIRERFSLCRYRRNLNKVKHRSKAFISQGPDRKPKARWAFSREVWEGLREPRRDAETPGKEQKWKATATETRVAVPGHSYKTVSDVSIKSMNLNS